MDGRSSENWSKVAFYQACIQSVNIHGGETWAVRQEDLSRMERNDLMIRWMCNVSLKIAFLLTC